MKNYFYTKNAPVNRIKVSAKANLLSSFQVLKQKEVAKILGVTPQYVAQVEKRALAKLRAGLRPLWEAYKRERSTPAIVECPLFIALTGDSVAFKREKYSE